MTNLMRQRRTVSEISVFKTTASRCRPAERPGTPVSKAVSESASHKLGRACLVRTVLQAYRISGMAFLALWIPLYRDRPVGRGSHRKLSAITSSPKSSSALPPAQARRQFLRFGLAKCAAEGGATERAIMDQTRHRSLKQVRKYIRRRSLFKDNAAARSGL